MSRPTHHRSCGRLVGILILTFFSTPLLAADSDEKLDRVKSMSRDERAALAKSLDRFDTLPNDERATIRSLDAGLTGLEPEMRSRLLAVLRRYHVFYKNLPEDKRKKLDAATDPATKLELVATFRAEQKGLSPVATAVADGVQVSALSPVRLRNVARELIVYFSLDPSADKKERAELYRMKNSVDRRNYALKLVEAKAFDQKAELRGRLRDQQIEFQEAEQKVIRNPTLARRLKQGEQEESKIDQSKKKADGARVKDLAAKLRGDAPPKGRVDLIQKLDEQQVLREFDSQVVESARLEAFESALPPWARQPLDDLPPDAARRRLKTLYRLVFPAPEEFQPPKTVEPPPKPDRASPPNEGGQATPF